MFLDLKMKKQQIKSQSINILNIKRFKETLLSYVKPEIKEEYESYIQNLVKDLKKQEKIKSKEKKSINKKKNKEKKIITDIDLNIIQYILSKKRRSQDELLVIKCFLSQMDFLSLLKTDIAKDKLLFSLCKYIKLEKKPQNNIIFRYGNKGVKFYIIFSGELSVLILKEKKVQIPYIQYLMHLIILKLLKEDDLILKIISNNFGANKVNKNEFDLYYENINKFVNKYFGKFNNKNKYFIEQDINFPQDTISNLDILFDSDNSSEEEDQEEEEKNDDKHTLKKDKNESIFDEEKYKKKEEKKANRKKIFNNKPFLLKIYNINKKLNYSEIPISHMDKRKKQFLVLYFIFCRELILDKKNFSSVNEYINYTYLNSPMHLSFDYENHFIDKEQFNLYQYFEITKLTKGDTFGELAFQHSDNKRTASIMTLTDTILGYLTKTDYQLSISDIELKKRKKNVNFIMSFSIFSQMNWYVFENKYFNYFKKEKFNKGERIMTQGQKNTKLFFIMDGQFEITTLMSWKNLYSLLKKKMGKDFDINQKPLFNKKFNFRIYISYNKDLLGLSDCYYYNDISFINATCMSIQSTVLSVEISILNELREKNPEIEADLKNFITKKQMIMVERLKIIYYKSIDSFKLFKNQKNVSSSCHKKPKHLKLNEEKDKDGFNEINGNNNFKENEVDFTGGIKTKNNNPPNLSNANIKLNLNLIKFLTNKNKKFNINKNTDIVYKINENSEKQENIYNSIEFNNELIQNQYKTYNTVKTEPCLINRKYNFNNQRKQKNDDDDNEEEKKNKINQIMKVKRISISAKDKFVLKSSKQLDRISNKHKTKKLIELYSPINKIIDKEYSNLFNWIEGSINKTPLKYNVRFNSEEKTAFIDNLKNNNNKKINQLARRGFSCRSTPKKINLNKNLKISDFKSKFNEESYKIIMNNSLNEEKRKEKGFSVNQKNYNNNTFISKKLRYKNDLDCREKTLKRLFAKFLKTESYFMKNKNKEKRNVKQNLHFNIISNLQQYNNLSSMACQKVNFFLCSENIKKKYGFESPTIYANNLLSNYFQNYLNSNECFKIK